MTQQLESVSLQLGDMLLLKATPVFAKKLKKDPNLTLVDEMEKNYRNEKTPIALMIMVAVVVLAALGVYPILVTTLAGAVLMFAAGVITPEEAYKSVRWGVIFLLAGLIPLGIALEKSGTSAFIANSISGLVGDVPVIWTLIGLYIFTTLLTEILSNNASVLLLVPIGINLSTRLGINPQLFVLVIMFAASTSFLTPVGYKTNTMVYGTGVYRFHDFLRTGALLNLLLAVLTPLILMHFFGK